MQAAADAGAYGPLDLEIVRELDQAQADTSQLMKLVLLERCRRYAAADGAGLTGVDLQSAPGDPPKRFGQRSGCAIARRIRTKAASQLMD